MTVMGQPASDTTSAAQQATIAAWRRRRLTLAGFDPRLAARLADEPAVDLHELLTLLDRGCAPELAARILAPLERDWP